VTIRSDEQWFSLIDSFHSAALGERTWDDVLQSLAVATGSQSAQLIGRTSDLTVLFNVMTNVDPALVKLTEARQPINPRPPVVRQTPMLRTVVDRDVIAAEECRRDAFYNEVLQPWDRPFFCATVLESREDAFVTLGVMRSQAAGSLSDEQRRTFSKLAPHVRTAVRLYDRIDGSGLAVLSGAMEALDIPMFICDRTGRVRLLTPAAETLVAGGDRLKLRNGRLTSARAEEARALQDAIEAALPAHREPERRGLQTVVIGANGLAAAPLVLDVFALPSRLRRPSLASLAPRVLIVACGQRKTETRRGAILGAVYGLTVAETEIAQRLAAGQPAQVIAAHRRVAVGTVRAQIKTIFAKLGVRRQTELTARLNQL
jgi:DNA-binding CsgD family transcriptional regulator